MGEIMDDYCLCRWRSSVYDSVMPGDKKVELSYTGNDTFFVTPESSDAFIFTRDAAGKIDGLKMYTMDGSYDESEKVS
jgi:hypothetical protein